jgi:hypothetical protein
MSIKTILLKRWEDIHDYGQKRGWLYRGQRVIDWPLQTSLERCCKRQSIERKRVREFEERLFREFQRAYHQYTQHSPASNDRIEWLSLMQHYGAPTRLLDFTYSIYIAAYFAAEFAEDDSAIWAIDGQWAVNQAAALFKKAGKPQTSRLTRLFDKGCEDLAETIFFKHPYALAAYPINPFRLNQRLLIQRGAFLIPGDISKPLMANLEAHRNYDDPQNVVKIVIPKAERWNVLRQLWNMNISRASLFPGLDGYAQSLTVYHYAYDPVWK